MHIRNTTWRDFRPLLALEKTCLGRDAWSWPDVLVELILPGKVRLIALKDNEFVGFVIGHRRHFNKLGWIAVIGVHPDYRRGGVGSRLLEDCERVLGTSRVRLTLRLSNAAAFQLYKKTGYIQIGRWTRYYRGGEDALLMEKVRS